MKILVVDDEQDVRRLFEQRFRRERRKGEIAIDFVFSGREALEYLRHAGHSELSLILSDINMPQMSGLVLLQQIRESYPELKVIMLTAYGDETNRQKAFELGAADYLTKPIDFKSLKEKIFN